MSDSNASSVSGQGTASSAASGAGVLKRSMLAAVFLKLTGGWGARLGLFWVALMVLVAVWAPVLASSHPFVWKYDGEVSSPWLEHLSPMDVTLFVAFFTGLVMIAIRLFNRRARDMAGRVWFLAWLWLGAGAGLCTHVWYLKRSLEQQIDAGTGLVFGVQAGLAVLLLLAVLIGLPVLVKAAFRWKVGVGLVGAVLFATLLWIHILPPETVVYAKYREAQAAGEVEWSVSAPLPYSANDAQRDSLVLTGQDVRFLPPSLKHPMGTTEAGMDLLSRMLHATRIALAIGVIATGISLAIGIAIGAWMGYAAGWVDLIGMRLVEIFAAIPVLFLLIMIVAFYGRSLALMMVVIGLTGWVGYALFVRAEFLRLRGMDYVMAARAVGVSVPGILFRHMLPNGVTPVLVLASFGVGSAILYEAVLSFLGLGLVDEPSWGQLLQEARRPGHHIGQVLFPGMAIFLTVFAYNLIGEALRDALDPKSIERSS